MRYMGENQEANWLTKLLKPHVERFKKTKLGKGPIPPPYVGGYG
jgi:hypothetical protein